MKRSGLATRGGIARDILLFRREQVGCKALRRCPDHASGTFGRRNRRYNDTPPTAEVDYIHANRKMPITFNRTSMGTCREVASRGEEKSDAVHAASICSPSRIGVLMALGVVNSCKSSGKHITGLRIGEVQIDGGPALRVVIETRRPTAAKLTLFRSIPLRSRYSRCRMGRRQHPAERDLDARACEGLPLWKAGSADRTRRHRNGRAGRPVRRFALPATATRGTGLSSISPTAAMRRSAWQRRRSLVKGFATTRQARRQRRNPSRRRQCSRHRNQHRSGRCKRLRPP